MANSNGKAPGAGKYQWSGSEVAQVLIENTNHLLADANTISGEMFL